MREEAFVQTVHRTYKCDLCRDRTDAPIGIEWHYCRHSEWEGRDTLMRADELKANHHLCPHCVHDIAAIAATLKGNP